MFRLLVVILSAIFFACGAFSAEAAERQRIQLRGSNAERQGENTDEILIRRERMREFRQEMLRQREEGVVPAPGWRGGRGNQQMDVTPSEQRNLRRLSPEERQRLRRDLRDAYNQR